MRFCLAFLIALFSISSKAQQEPIFTQYWNTYSIFNPATTGIFARQYIAATGRLQWIGLDNNPQIVSFIYDRGLAKINSGVGVNYYISRFGHQQDSKLNINYAYHIDLKKKRKLSLGAAISGIRKSVDYSQLTFGQYDPALPTEKEVEYNLDFNSGVMFASRRSLLGIGSTQLSESQNGIIKNVRHYWFNGTVNIYAYSDLVIRPGFYYRYAAPSGSLDLNIRMEFRKKYWLGGSYRFEDAVAFMGGLSIFNKLYIGYAYDHTTSLISTASTGSHEVVLTLLLDKISSATFF